jgi:prophage tail gpP-like protein
MREYDNEVTLWVDGHLHAGWLDVSVTLNLDHMAGSFTLVLTEEYLDDSGLVRLPVRPGASCRLKIDDVTVLTGWVDTCTHSFAAADRSVTVTGRDRTGDLVDCSAEVKTYRKRKLEDIAADMCAPFGIKVSVADDTGPAIDSVSVNTGDTVQASLERLCRKQGVLVWADGLGNMVLGHAKAGAPVATLERGVNVLSASAADNHSGRFSRIIVRGPSPSPSAISAAVGSHGEGVAEDGEITRYRPKIINAEANGAPTDLTLRAAHERRVAKGKSRAINASVQGWRHDSGLWRPGQCVVFNDDWLDVSGVFVVGNVVLSKNSDKGTVADLKLYPPDAFDPHSIYGEGQQKSSSGTQAENKK